MLSTSECIASIARQGSYYPKSEFTQSTFGVCLTAVVVLLIAFSLSLPLAANSTGVSGSVTIAWNPNPESDVVGYRVHYGSVSGSYTQVIDVGPVTAFAIPGLSRETSNFCSVTAYNAYGVNSDFAQELVIPIVPPIGEEKFCIKRMTLGADQLITFEISGMIGTIVEVWASPNLADWTHIDTITNVSGPITIDDAAAEGQPRRFYQLRTP